MNAPAQPVPQASANGFPSMKVVRALAAASKRVAEVTCSGKSGDPRDPYAYARADDLVAAAKDAIHAEGLLVLPASSDEKPEPVGNGAVIWLRQTFNVVHVESGEWLPFQADPWPLQQHKPIDKAMATAKTASKAYFYLSLLEIRRVGPNAEDMDADLPPVFEQTPKCSDKPAERSDKTPTDSAQVGVSPRAKQSASGAHLSRKIEAENRPKVDPEVVKRELDKAALEAFAPDELQDPTVPPAPAEKFDATNLDNGAAPTGRGAPESPVSSTSLEAGPSKSDGESLSSSTESPKLPAKDTSSEAGTSNVSSAGDSASPSESPAPGPSGSELVQPTMGQVAVVSVLAKRVAEARVSKWSTAKTRKARKPYACGRCQERGAADNECAIQPKDEHKDDGSGGRLCMACFGQLESEASKGAA